MIRVKDAEKSLKFYQDVMGMKLLRESANSGFTLYFLRYPSDEPEKEGLLELTWNHGTEKDEAFTYHNGNEQPQGFGHIGKTHTNTKTHKHRVPPSLSQRMVPVLTTGMHFR